MSRTSRDGKRRYVEARYQPPVWAYAKWPDLPKHYSRRFDADYTAMAEAWLADVERHIRLGDWEPPRIVVSKTRATAGTSSGLSSPAMTADGHASITLRSILKRAAWVLAHFWPGMRSRRFAHSGCRRRICGQQGRQRLLGAAGLCNPRRPGLSQAFLVRCPPAIRLLRSVIHSFRCRTHISCRRSVDSES